MILNPEYRKLLPIMGLNITGGIEYFRVALNITGLL